MYIRLLMNPSRTLQHQLGSGGAAHEREEEFVLGSPPPRRVQCNVNIQRHAVLMLTMSLGRNAGKRMSTHELNESASVLRKSLADRETGHLRVLRKKASLQSGEVAPSPRTCC